MNRWLFPEEKRDFAARRYVNIALRTLHLVGIAGFSGLFLFQLPAEIWQPYARLAVTTGLAMLLLEIWTDGICILQLKGLAIFVKLAILLSIVIFPQIGQLGFWTIILISGYFSHAPGRVRYYVPLYGQVLKSSADLRSLKQQ